MFPENDNRVTFDVRSLSLPSVRFVPVDRKRLAKLRHLAKIQGIRNARGKPRYHATQQQWKVIFGERGFWQMWLLAQPPLFWYYRWRMLRAAGTSAAVERVVSEFGPDVIIHPTVLEGLFVADLAYTSESSGIPFVALMNSWDNPSTKALVVKPPDYLAVWGEQTLKHAVDFVGMAPERVRILGSAQFDVYRQQPTKSREQLCSELGVHDDVKLILYGGSSKSVNEIDHLRLLDAAVASGELPGCHIVFRPHPWRARAEGEPDFQEVPWRHVSMDPSMRPYYMKSSKGEKGRINLPDYMDTHNILSAVDLLVNNVSTILLEACLHGKPALCLVSDEELAGNWFLRSIYRSIFFQELLERLGIPTCRERIALARMCREQLGVGSAPGYRERMRRSVSYFVRLDDEPYSDKLQDLIEQAAGA